jgi:hypothetical protein
MSEEKKELIFVEGMRFFKPREGAPQSIKGNIVINLAELREFIKKQGVTETLRADLRKSESKGTYYITLNTWKPMEKEEDKIDPQDIPF